MTPLTPPQARPSRLASHPLDAPSRRLQTAVDAAALRAALVAADADAADLANSYNMNTAILGSALSLKAADAKATATAAAAETLGEFGERKFYAADRFTAFAAHAITKRSGEKPERLLALFVVAINDLQMLGLCHASKRPRGTIEKRFFG